MKKLFIYAKSSIEAFNFNTETLPKSLGLVTTIQYIDELPKLQAFLKEHNIESTYGGQILGCDSMNATKLDEPAILYLGSGEFHPVGIALRSKKEVFKLHPISMQVTKVTQDQINTIEKKKYARYAKFLDSKNIGILLTTKDGQSRAQGGKPILDEIQTKFPDKKFYHFLSDTLNFAELENFNFIDCWVNTMCPRIMEDINTLNLEDLKKISEENI